MDQKFQPRLTIFIMLAALAAGACSLFSRPPVNSEPFATEANVVATEPLVTVSPTAALPNALPTPTPLPPTITSLPPAPPPQDPIFGIEMHKINAEGGLEQVVQTGNHWIRYNRLNWAKVEAVEGVRDWTAAKNLESYLKNAAAAGMPVILIVHTAPTWAIPPGSKPCAALLPDKLEAFGKFLHDAVARYSQPPFNVKYWELGNEPDVPESAVPENSPFGCWGKAGDPYFGGREYAHMLKIVYPQIKAADPQAVVLTGGLLMDCDPVNPPETEEGSGILKDCTPSRFLEGILEGGAGEFFDGVAFHAYDYYGGKPGHYSNANWHSVWDVTGPVLIAKNRYVRSVLFSYGLVDKLVMNTESALICGRDGKEAYCQTGEFNLTKAYYLAQSYSAALAENLQANIWYSISGWRASGLVDKNLQTNQAYEAFTTASKALKNAGYGGELRQYPGVKGYEFNREGVRLWLLWSLDGGDHDINLPASPNRSYDVFGAPFEAGISLKVGLAPIYLEW